MGTHIYKKYLPYTICRGSRKKARAAVGKIANGGMVFACQKTAHAGRLHRVFIATAGRQFEARASKTALPTAEGRKSRKKRRFSARQIFFQRGLRLSRRPAVPPLASPSRRLRLQTAAAYAGRPWAANSFSRPPLRKSAAAPRGAEAGRRGNPNPRVCA